MDNKYFYTRNLTEKNMEVKYFQGYYKVSPWPWNMYVFKLKIFQKWKLWEAEEIALYDHPGFVLLSSLLSNIGIKKVQCLFGLT